ncbi:MAG: hypothetical protein ACLP8A_05220 [Methylovirgula sp.]
MDGVFGGRCMGQTRNQSGPGMAGEKDSMRLEHHLMAVALLAISAMVAWGLSRILNDSQKRTRIYAVAGVVLYGLLSVAIVYATGGSGDQYIGIRSTPRGLVSSGLRAQGLSDDGWAAQNVKLTLGSMSDGVQRIVIHGVVPSGMDLDNQRITLLANGKTLAEEALKLGDFVIGGALASNTEEVSVDFASQHLLKVSDTRLVSAMIKSITIMNLESIPDAVRAIPTDLTNPRLEYQGIYQDGWAGSHVKMLLASHRAGNHRIIVRGLIPKDVGLDQQRVSLVANGALLTERQLTPGEFVVEAPIGAGVQQTEVKFAVEHRISKDDPRVASAILRSVSIE